MNSGTLATGSEGVTSSTRGTRMKLATGALTYVGPVAAINPALYKDLGFNFIRDIACRHERRPQNHPTAHSRPLCAHHRRARHTTVSAIKRGDRSLSEFDDRRQDPQETRWRSSSPDSTSCRRSSTHARLMATSNAAPWSPRSSSAAA
jgi:hypothetical protein